MKQKSRKGMLYNSNHKNELTAIDIFAGGGGLTVGLKRAGFNVIAAVENEENAFATYKINHPEVQIYKQDVRSIEGNFLKNNSPTKEIDLLAGCPPCQGFCSLTAKYKKNDDRNELILEMARLIKEIKPKSVMLENVPGLNQRGKKLFIEFLNVLDALGYQTEWDILQVADYGIPQNRRRLVLLSGLGFKIQLPPPTHAKKKSDCLKSWTTLDSVINKMPKPVTLDYATRNGGPQAFNWHVVRNISEKNTLRLKKIKPGRSRKYLPDYLRPKCHKSKNTGFSNVYGRAAWKQVSPTITGGCTTLSKGRFGHPKKNRTFSVLEAALIQTFPSNYIFDTPYMDYVCDIIGNALPCDFAEILAKQCFEKLISNNKFN